MKKIGLLVATVMVIGSVAQGALVNYTGTASGNIEDGANWAGGTVPNQPDNANTGTVASVAVQFSVQTPTPSTIIFSGTSSLKNNVTGKTAVRIGNSTWTFNDASSLNFLDGGGATDHVVFGRGAAGGSTMIWNSTGTLSGVNDLRLGNAANQLGFITQNAGSFVVGDSLSTKYGSGFTMAGGTLTANNLIIDGTLGDDWIDFVTTGTTGTMTFANGGADYTTALQGFITAGDILKDGASASVSDFSISFSGSETSISVIPEPATLGLVAVFGGGILFIRRKLMM